ncbi:DUF663-domain-containing protein [Peniophora sp. CONT]|nr:DUF663-domain-containing protein [Peniophora sp. CONT]
MHFGLEVTDDNIMYCAHRRRLLPPMLQNKDDDPEEESRRLTMATVIVKDYLKNAQKVMLSLVTPLSPEGSAVFSLYSNYTRRRLRRPNTEKLILNFMREELNMGPEHTAKWYWDMDYGTEVQSLTKAFYIPLILRLPSSHPDRDIVFLACYLPWRMKRAVVPAMVVGIGKLGDIYLRLIWISAARRRIAWKYDRTGCTLVLRFNPAPESSIRQTQRTATLARTRALSRWFWLEKRTRQETASNRAQCSTYVTRIFNSSARPGSTPTAPPSLTHAMQRSAPRDIARWVLFASAVTIASTGVCAFLTNEISERALEDSEDVLDLWDFNMTLDEYIEKHGNAALRLAPQDWVYIGGAMHVRSEAKSFKSDVNGLSQYRDLDKDKVRKAHEMVQLMIEQMGSRWNKRLNDAYLNPGVAEGPLCTSVALPLIASWTLLAVLVRTRRFKPIVDRLLPIHSLYSPRGYTILTSVIRPNTDMRFTWKTLPVIICGIPMLVTSAGAVFLADSEGSPSDLMEATFLGRFASFALSAAVWGNVYALAARRILQSNSRMILGVSSARAGIWSAFAIYALTAVMGHDPEPTTLALTAAVPLLAAYYSPGGVLFAVAYSSWAVGPKAFDAARRLTFSSERYPLLGRMRRFHKATAERRAVEAREFGYAQVRANVDDPLSLLRTFWSVGFTVTCLLLRMYISIPIVVSSCVLPTNMPTTTTPGGTDVATARARAYDAPIYRLPTELLVLIFSTLVHMTLPDYTIMHLGPVAYENKPKAADLLRGVPWVCLPCVSRGWRAAADLCVELWTTVNFWTHETTERLLLKSNGQALHLVYYEGSRYLPSDPDVFMSAASSGILARARTVTFRYYGEGHRVLQGRAPREPTVTNRALIHTGEAQDGIASKILEMVLRNPSRTVQEHNIIGPPNGPVSITLALFPRTREDLSDDKPLDSPSLRVLRLRRVFCRNTPNFIQYPLVHLEVTQCTGVWHNTAALLDTLSHLPALQTLVLFGCTVQPSDITNRDLIHLPFLARLTLIFSNPTFPLLHHIRFPRSTIVTIQSIFTPDSRLGTASDVASIQDWIHLLLSHIAAPSEELHPSERQLALDVVEFMFRNIKQPSRPSGRDRSLHIDGYRYAMGIQTRVLDVHLTAVQPMAIMRFPNPTLTFISSKLPALVSSNEDHDRRNLNESTDDGPEILFYQERIARRDSSTSRSALALSRPFPDVVQLSRSPVGELTISHAGVGSPADETEFPSNIKSLMHVLFTCFSLMPPETSPILSEVEVVQPSTSHNRFFEELQEVFGDRCWDIVHWTQEGPMKRKEVAQTAARTWPRRVTPTRPGIAGVTLANNKVQNQMQSTVVRILWDFHGRIDSNGVEQGAWPKILAITSRVAKNWRDRGRLGASAKVAELRMARLDAIHSYSVQHIERAVLDGFSTAFALRRSAGSLRAMGAKSTVEHATARSERQAAARWSSDGLRPFRGCALDGMTGRRRSITMPEAFHHRPTLKQTNKAFKSRHASKSSLKEISKGAYSYSSHISKPLTPSIIGRPATTAPRQSPKSTAASRAAAQSKLDRKNHARQAQNAKRSALVSATRVFAGVDGAPRIVAIIPLAKDVDVRDVSRGLAGAVGEDGEGSENGIGKVRADRFKTSLQFIHVPYGQFYAALDAAKAADYVVLALSPETEVDEWGDTLLRTLQSQGLPTPCAVIPPSFSTSDAKTRSGVLKSLLSFTQYFAPDVARVYDLGVGADALGALRVLAEGKPKDVRWREGRVWVLGEEVRWDEEEEAVKVTGVVRGAGLSANRLVHIPNFGDFQIAKIESAPLPRSTARKTAEAMDVEPTTLAQPDSDADSLVSSNDPDDMSNEQTWPTEEEMAGTGASQNGDGDMPDASNGTTPKTVRRIPKGMSEYQAAWILDDDEDGDEDGESVDGKGEGGEDGWVDEDEEEMVDMPVEDDVESRRSVMFQDLDEDEEERQLENWKNRDREEQDDTQFPDEIDTPRDIPARQRFARYRGLRSMRTSPWDPYESLPRDYARIFQFEDYKRSERAVRRRAEADVGAVIPGTRVTVTIKAPREAAEVKSGAPFVLFGLHEHEHKKTVLNFTVLRNTEYDGSVRSKDELILCIGPRRLLVKPIYSQHTRGGARGPNNVHKFERYLRHGTTTVASIYAPIVYGNQPITLLRASPSLPQSPSLVASGTFKDSDPTRIIAKRILLSGHPFKVHRKTATVRYMFFNADDVLYYKPIQLTTKMGRTGHIKESLGTHGYFKAHFDGGVSQMDTVLMSLYKRVFPRWSEIYRVEEGARVEEVGGEDEMMQD